MNIYKYCVNTFKKSEPIQLYGYVEARSEEKAVRKLIKDGLVDPHGYEFLELRVVSTNDYAACDNPTKYEKTVIDRLRLDGLEDNAIKKILREI